MILTGILDTNPSLTFKELQQPFYEKTGISMFNDIKDRLDCYPSWHGHPLKKLIIQLVIEIDKIEGNAKRLGSLATQ